MARFVFFSFAYEDVKNFKVNVVRNSWLLNHREETFIDGSIWESEITKEDDEIKDLISFGLNGTSVTVVLIGQNTANRRWVNYEIVKSFDKGNGILGIHINRIRGKTGRTARGRNPLQRLGFQISEDGRKVYFFELKDGKWETFIDLPVINNKKSNTLYSDTQRDFGSFYCFSDIFSTMCWDFDVGHQEFTNWIENTAQQAGR